MLLRFQVVPGTGVSVGGLGFLGQFGPEGLQQGASAESWATKSGILMLQAPWLPFELQPGVDNRREVVPSEQSQNASTL